MSIHNVTIEVSKMSFEVRIVHPSTSIEFEKYYNLRWEILRKPWNQPKGSEKDDLEKKTEHIMVTDMVGNAIGVCRLQMNDNVQAQIRFMAVHSQYQGKGIGRLLINEAEKIAKEKKAHFVFLQARENATGFYLKNGYDIIEKTFLIYNTIQHFSMIKKI